MSSEFECLYVYQSGYLDLLCCIFPISVLSLFLKLHLSFQVSSYGFSVYYR